MPLPSIKNSVGMAVASVASAGVGDITLGAALSGGYQTAATAYGANANIDIRIEEGDTWEICRDCTYTHSGTTVTRGTLEDGSSGTSTRVAFTTAAKVYVVETAERMRRTVGGYLEHASHDGSAAVTGVVGTLHVFTGLTADRVFTLPAAAAAGDRVGVTFPAGSASYEILLKSASGDKINNVDCSTTEWSRLFIAGETVIFRCVDASAVDWIVEYDGRIPQTATLLLSSDCDGESAGVFTLPTSAATPGAWANSGSVGIVADTSTGKLISRRAGVFNVFAAGRTKDAVADTNYFAVGIYKNGNLVDDTTVTSSGTQVLRTFSSLQNAALAVDDYLQLLFRSGAGSLGLRGNSTYLTSLSVTEVL